MEPISQTSRQGENVENGLDPHVWQAAADVIAERMAKYAHGRTWDGEIKVTEKDVAMAAWVVGELHKFGFIKDPNK